MPCIWSTLDNDRALLAVFLIDAARLGGQSADVPDGPTGPLVQALVDTGAQRTMVSTRLARDIGLRPIGKVPVLGIGGLSYHFSYAFSVGFHVPGNGVIAAADYVLENAIEGGGFDAVGAPFDVLLGMDIIGLGSLSVEGNGTFSFCF